MPRVHEVQKARKAVESAGIAVGDRYFWWAFRYGGKRYSKIYPKQSQLTQSDFLGQVYSLQERIEDLSSGSYEPADLKSELEDIASEARTLGEEQSDKLGNMPEGLQSGPTGELLQERADACEAWADELENVEVEEPDRDSIAEEMSRERKASMAEGQLALTEEEAAQLEVEIDERFEQECADAISSAIDAAQGTEAPSA